MHSSPPEAEVVEEARQARPGMVSCRLRVREAAAHSQGVKAVGEQARSRPLEA